MKTILDTLRYHLAVYQRTTKYVAPFTALLVILAGVYGMKPIAVVNSYAFACGLLFFVSVLAGFSYGDAEDPVAEQLVCLRLGRLRHGLIKALYVWLLGAAFGVMAALLPVLFHVLNWFTLFKRSLTVSDVVFAVVLDGFMGGLGATVGAFFHPRIIRDRRQGMLLAGCVSLVGFVKIGFIRLFAPVKWVIWLFPPVSDVVDLFFAKEVFEPRLVGIGVGIMLFYTLVVIAVQIVLLERRRF